MKRYGYIFVAVCIIGVLGLVNAHVYPMLHEYPQPPSGNFVVISPVPEGFVPAGEQFSLMVYVPDKYDDVVSVTWQDDTLNPSPLYHSITHVWTLQHPAINQTGKINFQCSVTYNDGQTEYWSRWFQVENGIKSTWYINGHEAGTNASLWSPLAQLSIKMLKQEGLEDYNYIVGFNISTVQGVTLKTLNLTHTGESTWESTLQLPNEGEYLLTLYVYKTMTYPPQVRPSSTYIKLDQAIRMYYLYGHPAPGPNTVVFTALIAVGIVGTLYAYVSDETKHKSK